MLDKMKQTFSAMMAGDDDTDAPYEGDVIAEINEEFTKRQKDKLPLELQWRLNINFVEGNQYMVINTSANELEEAEPMFDWQERLVYNHTAPIVETRLAKLSRITPTPKVRPATNEKEDISAAKVSNKLLENIINGIKAKELQMQANAWAEHTGTCVWKEIWDSNSGRLLGSYNGSDIHEGDVDSIPLNPFEVFPDNLFVDNITGCHDIIHAKAYHIREVKRIWGVEVTGTSVNVMSLRDNTYGSGTMGNRGGGYSIASQNVEDHVIVLEKWEMPSEDYPDGRLIICTDSELLYAGVNPYKVGKDNEVGLPFTLQKCVVIPGHFFGDCIVKRLIPLQQAYNSLRNRKKEYMNRCAIGVMAAEEGTVDEDYLEQQGLAPGAILIYKRGTVNIPQFLQFPPLPPTFSEEEAIIMADFNRISGVSEISRDSSAPTGVNSGIALSILQEQDDTRLSLTAKNIENRMIRACKVWLRLYKQFATVPRLLKSIGKDNYVEALEFHSSDIRSDDVYIETSSSLSETPAQRKQFVLDLLQSGLLNDPETGALDESIRKQVFTMLELGNWEQFDNETSLQIARAKRENILMLQGDESVMVRDYDDHVIHIKEHNMFRLTADFEEMTEDDPDVADMFEQHNQLHIQGMQSHMAPEEGVAPEGELVDPEAQEQLDRATGNYQPESYTNQEGELM